MSSPTTRRLSRSSSRSAGCPSWIPCRRRRNPRSSRPVRRVTDASCPNRSAGNRGSEALLTDEGNEAARDRPNDGRALRAPDDDLQVLHTPLADRDDETSTRLELLVQRAWELGCCRGDGNGRERRTLRPPARSGPDVDSHAPV